MRSYAVAGLQNVLIAPPSGTSLSLEQHATRAIIKNTVNVSLNTLIQNQNFGQALRQGLRGLVAETVGGWTANQIGAAYGKEDLDFLSHKVAHGILGTATGAILAGKEGLLPGALGAMTAEVIGDLFLVHASDLRNEVMAEAEAEGCPVEFDSSAYRSRILEKIETKANWAVFGSAIVAVLADCDVDVATFTATNAVENNLIPLLMGTATLGMAAWTVYDVVDTYLNEGIEAAVEKLIIDGAITVATASIGKLASKGCAKLLPKETVHQLWTQYCLDNPFTTKLIQKLSNKPLDHQVLKGLEKNLVEKIHKNSHAYKGEAHVYRIIDKEGKTYKIGESAQGVRKGDGASIRAEAQARKLRKETGERFETQIRKTYKSKKEAHRVQHETIKRFRGIHGEQSLPGNKSNY